MKNSYGDNKVFKITFTGIMLGLVLLFQFLEEFMPFTEYMKLNLSLVFIMAAMYLVGFNWAFLLLILRFAIGPAVSSASYTNIGLWSHFTLFIFGLMFMVTFYTFHKYIFKGLNESKNLLLTSIVSITIVSLVGILINAFLITPVFYTFFGQHGISQEATKVSYENAKVAYFDIPNYYGGISLVYGVGNIIKFTLISVAFIPLWKIIKRHL